jgi:hypothetical protein
MLKRRPAAAGWGGGAMSDGFGDVAATVVAYPTACVVTAGITSALMARKNPGKVSGALQGPGSKRLGEALGFLSIGGLAGVMSTLAFNAVMSDSRSSMPEVPISMAVPSDAEGRPLMR